MKREIIIDSAPDFVRAAVVEDGRLCELHMEHSAGERLTETLFYGRVQSVRPSVHAAFVDIGQDKNAFLPLAEGQKLRGGDMLIVQGAAKQSTETKGLRITARINLAGKWLVLAPGESGVFISKKVKDPQMREDLAALGREICPEGCAVIIRTASEEATPERMAEEANMLFAKWQEAERRAKGMTKPGVLLAQEPLNVRLARDLAGPELERIVTNNDCCCQRLQEAQKAERIPETTKLERFEEKDQLLFDFYNLETQIDKALKKRVWLPCGGYLILDFTEALTVIDVNSGKMITGKNMEETALTVYLEAVSDIARQIRLRDIGGIIVVDLIDMARTESREAVIAAMKEAAKADRAPITVEGITRLGLLEMTRRRKGEQLHLALQTGCTYCSSCGRLIAPEEIARRALRQIRRKALSGQAGPFVAALAPDCAQALSKMPQPKDCAQIYVLPSAGRHMERIEIIQLEAAAAPPKGVLPLNPHSNI